MTAGGDRAGAWPLLETKRSILGAGARDAMCAVRGHAVCEMWCYMTQQTSLAPLPSGMSRATPAGPSPFVAR